MTTTATAAGEQNDLVSRLPEPPNLRTELLTIARGMNKAVRNGAIPAKTIGLVQLRAGQLIGNTYHTVDKTNNLRKAGESEERITAVASWRDAPYFTEAERIALELVEAVLTPNPNGERVPDEMFTRATIQYDERALWTLTLAISQICFFIPVGLIAKPIPGRAPGKNYSKPSEPEEGQVS
ncbi:carboxymuconolactone decarboxylase family protein [Microlunatus sp. GCM10028923]|uniref:carboxymuconolactone decarboxylase family protein n=1 Tax=Microlunatus sp. GCM10028923 TaxID=3273400 RepID=UPI00360C6445